MDPLKKVPMQFQNALEEYFISYFTKRDYHQLEKLLSENFFVYGTGQDERAYSKADALKIFKRDLETVPNPIDYLFEKQEFLVLDERTAVFHGELNMETTILEEHFSFNNLRLTLVFHLENDDVKIVAKHISLPTIEQEEGESFPIKDLEERKKFKNQGIEIRF